MGGKGLIDVLIYKKTIADHMSATSWLASHGFDDDTIRMITEFAKGHDEFRMRMGYNEDLDIDLSWISTLPLSGQLLVRLFEAAALIPDVRWCNAFWTLSRDSSHVHISLPLRLQQTRFANSSAWLNDRHL